MTPRAASRSFVFESLFARAIRTTIPTGRYGGQGAGPTSGPRDVNPTACSIVSAGANARWERGAGAPAPGTDAGRALAPRPAPTGASPSDAPPTHAVPLPPQRRRTTRTPSPP